MLINQQAETVFKRRMDVLEAWLGYNICKYSDHSFDVYLKVREDGIDAALTDEDKALLARFCLVHHYDPAHICTSIYSLTLDGNVIDTLDMGPITFVDHNKD